ncbi:unnamed protein product, partial [Iphiclides podalirius]
MDEFQKEVRTSIPAASPSSNINAQFSAFRTFVLSALENLQLQLQLLSRQQDEMEVRMRRKMLLLHGVPEVRDENPLQCITRNRFGVSRCWTRDGSIVILGRDGTRHRVVSVAEVNVIPDEAGSSSATSTAVTAATVVAAPSAPKPSITGRVRKPIKK